jgi:uncharacterized protein (TIGR01777 family)
MHRHAHEAHGLAQVQLSTQIPFSADAVWDWHQRPGAFERMSPPWRPVEVLDTGAGVALGEGKTLRMAAGPFHMRWQVRHTAVEPGRGFVDEQTQGPLASWRHEHWFEPAGATTCRLVDTITYRLPARWLAQPVAGGQVRAELERMLRFRHARLDHDLRLHAASGERRLRVAITGATGLVGRQLTALLTSGGHDVVRLLRGPVGNAEQDARWDPRGGSIDADKLEGLDAVIHLAGESISDGRWSSARKREIRASRVNGTALLANTLAGLARPPRVFVSASAIGYYGNRGAELLTEESGPGHDFLSEVCQAWEAAAEPAQRAGIRVVHPRLGVVIAAGGGLLARTLPLFNLGLGGRLGDGNQYMSWIGLDDLLASLLHICLDDTLAGPVNAVAPRPVTNREFTTTLADVLGRPAHLPAPAPALRLAFGELANGLLLASQRAVPAQLERAGFHFECASLAQALSGELGREPRALQPATTLAPAHPSHAESAADARG